VTRGAANAAAGALPRDQGSSSSLADALLNVGELALKLGAVSRIFKLPVEKLLERCSGNWALALALACARVWGKLARPRLLQSARDRRALLVAPIARFVCIPASPYV
jgi:hypothetical protein